MSPQNQHLTQAMLRKPATTTPKQFQTTWCFGKDGQHAGGAGDLVSNGVPRDPAILFFSVQRLHGFRQVVQHALLSVANWD